MRLFSRIVLGIGIFMVSMFLLAVAEYFSPGLITAAMKKIDGWISWVQSAGLFFAIFLSGLGIVTYCIVKFGPLVFAFLANQGIDVFTALRNFAGSRAGRITFCIISVMLLVGGVMMGIWAVRLFLF